MAIPRRKDCFYVVHNVNPKIKEYFRGFDLMNYGVLTRTTKLSGWTEIQPNVFHHPQPWESYSAVQFYWGTDLLPHEIEANKPKNRVFFGESNRVINYVGTIGGEYDTNTRPFGQACWESGILFRTVGGYGNTGPVTLEENVRLVRESYMAPAIVTPSQMKSGYIPCRIFKNISYGQMGVTNSPYVNAFFGNELICDSDSYNLFHAAKASLPHIHLSTLYTLMDEIARNHTYLNRIDALIAGAQRA